MPTASPQPVRCSKVTQAVSAAMRSRQLQHHDSHHDSDVILVVTVRWRRGRQKMRASKLLIMGKLAPRWRDWMPCGGAWEVAVADEERHTLPPSMGRIPPHAVATDECVDAAFAKFRWRQRSSTVRALSDLTRKPGEKIDSRTIRRRRVGFEAHSHLEEW
jgi:hypothetical protein